MVGAADEDDDTVESDGDPPMPDADAVAGAEDAFDCDTALPPVPAPPMAPPPGPPSSPGEPGRPDPPVALEEACADMEDLSIGPGDTVAPRISRGMRFRYSAQPSLTQSGWRWPTASIASFIPR